MWKTFLVVAVLATLVGCSPGTDNQPAAERSAQSQLPEAPPPNPDGTPDPVLVQKLVEAGADPDEAPWLALTAWNYTIPEPGVLHLVMTYPWGDTTRIELRLSRADPGEARPPEMLETSIQPGRISGTLRYYVSDGDLPGLDASALLQGPGTRFNPVDLLIPTAHAQASGGYNRAVQSWVTETASDEIRDKFFEGTLGKGFGGSVTGALNVVDTAEKLDTLSGESRKLLDEIDQLRKCTEENPSGVQQSQEEKDKILRHLDELREAIVVGVHAKAAMIVASTAVGMQPIKVLGVAASAALAMSAEQTQQVIENQMNDIRKSASKACRKSYKVINHLGDCPRTGTPICDITKPFKFTCKMAQMDRTTTYTPTRSEGGAWSEGNWEYRMFVGGKEFDAQAKSSGRYRIDITGDGQTGQLYQEQVGALTATARSPYSSHTRQGTGSQGQGTTLKLEKIAACQ